MTKKIINFSLIAIIWVAIMIFNITFNTTKAVPSTEGIVNPYYYEDCYNNYTRGGLQSKIVCKIDINGETYHCRFVDDLYSYSDENICYYH